MVEYCIMFAFGLVAGGLSVLYLMWKRVRMYRLLWENEKNGNFLMVKKMIAIEENRNDDD